MDKWCFTSFVFMRVRMRTRIAALLAFGFFFLPYYRVQMALAVVGRAPLVFPLNFLPR